MFIQFKKEKTHSCILKVLKKFYLYLGGWGGGVFGRQTPFQVVSEKLAFEGEDNNKNPSIGILRPQAQRLFLLSPIPPSQKTTPFWTLYGEGGWRGGGNVLLCLLIAL